MAPERQGQGYTFYLTVISLAGLLLIAWGVVQIPGFTPPIHFVLLLLLAATAQVATTSASVSEQAGITYTVGTAVAMATVPFFGPAAAVLVVAVDNLSLWLIKRQNAQTWKKNGRQLAFNTGMHSIAIFVAGNVLLLLLSWLGSNGVGTAVSWLLAALIYEEINLWLLIGVLRLQHGASLNPWEVWREDRWASVIDVLVTGIGGGVLAYALTRFNTPGLLVFFLPILLSALAFQIYVRNMKAHMDNLETIVADRTSALETLNREKDAFLALLTHDMKSPLNTIGLTADLLNSYPHFLQERPHLIQLILRSQQTLEDMVSSILDLEKLQAGGVIPLHKTLFNLADLVQAAHAVVQIQAQNKETVLQMEPVQEAAVILGDPKQLERVFVNLLSNAIKYSPNGSSITLSVGKQEGKAAVQIRDNGYGIPAEELPFIFERFRRVQKHAGISSGTGLGLAIAKAIVEAHDGQITVRSEEDSGTTFWVTLPLA